MMVMMMMMIMMIVFGDTAAISITCVYINYYIKYKKSYIYIYI